jgi:hypothetical protein
VGVVLPVVRGGKLVVDWEAQKCLLGAGTGFLRRDGVGNAARRRGKIPKFAKPLSVIDIVNKKKVQ